MSDQDDESDQDDGSDQDNESYQPPSDGQRIATGLIVIAIGFIPLLAGLGVQPFSSGIVDGVPSWLVIVTGVTLMLGGLAALTQKTPALSEIVAVAAIVGLAAIFNWIAFGAGTRACSSSIGWISREAGDIECRLAFGWGGLMLDVFVILALAAILRRVLGERPWVEAIDKAGKWLMVLVFAPLILILILVAPFMIMFQALGKWLAKRFGRDAADK